MNLHDKFDGFSIELFIDHDGEWLAHFVELPNVSAYGETPEQALHELQKAWLAMKESYTKHNQPLPIALAKKDYSGQFNVRIDRRVHRALPIEAAHAGISLNALVAQKLSHSVPDYLKYLYGEANIMESKLLSLFVCSLLTGCCISKENSKEELPGKIDPYPRKKVLIRGKIKINLRRDIRKPTQSLLNGVIGFNPRA